MLLQINKKAQLTGHNASVFAISPSRQEGYFLSGSGEGWIVEWDLANPEMGKLLARVGRQIFSLLHLPGTPLVVAGNMDGGLHWVNLDDQSLTRNIAHHSKGAFAVLSLGEYLFTGGGEGRITRWSIPEIRSLESLQLSHASIRVMRYSAVRHEIAAGASDGNIYLLDPEDLSIRHTIRQAHQNSVFSLCYAPDGQYLLSGGRDAHLRAWDTADWNMIMEQPAHWYTINDIAFHPQGQVFATASRDKTLKIWDAGSFKLLKVLEAIRSGGHVNSVNTLLWDTATYLLISGSDDRSLILWDVALP